MTRDRKKIFISSVERTIAQLEQQNRKMRKILIHQAQQSSVVSSVASLIASTPPTPMMGGVISDERVPERNSRTEGEEREKEEREDGRRTREMEYDARRGGR